MPLLTTLAAAAAAAVLAAPTLRADTDVEAHGRLLQTVSLNGKTYGCGIDYTGGALASWPRAVPPDASTSAATAASYCASQCAATGSTCFGWSTQQLSSNSFQCTLRPSSAFSGSSVPSPSACTGPRPGTQTSPSCPAGSIITFSSGRTQCTACVAGRITTTANDWVCTACALGKYGASQGLSVCADCVAGTFANSTATVACTPCAVGRYVDADGAQACISCPGGSFTDVTGRSVCTACDAGQFASGTSNVQCSDCMPGRFSYDLGQAECTPCESGFYQDEYRATSCKTCGIGQEQPQPGQTGCKACDPGSYGDAEGLGACWDCPAGQISTVEGAQWCDFCPSGTSTVGLPRQTSCTLCETGTYAVDPGTDVCPWCNPGFVAPYEGSSSCDSCGTGTFSQGIGWSECSLCAAGFYQPNVEQSECLACSTGYMQRLLGQTACEQCMPGRFAPDEGTPECPRCPAGTFSGSYGATACQSCGLGSYSALGYTACQQCERGRYSTIASGAEDCTDCSAGTYQPATGRTECLECGLGRYSNIKAWRCFDCTPGKFAASATSASCSNCPAGTISTTAAASSCQTCSANTWAAAGLSTCTNCGCDTRCEACPATTGVCTLNSGYDGCVTLVAGTRRCGCSIDATCVADGAAQAGNACLVCDITTSRTAWTNICPSPTSTVTPSVTATASSTMEPSASNTASVSASMEPSISNTPSVSASMEPSASSSASVSASMEPSASNTASVSASMEPSATNTASVSASMEPSASNTASVSPSMEPSSSNTASVSATMEPSVSSSMAPSASITASSTPSPTRAAAVIMPSRMPLFIDTSKAGAYLPNVLDTVATRGLGDSAAESGDDGGSAVSSLFRGLAFSPPTDGRDWNVRNMQVRLNIPSGSSRRVILALYAHAGAAPGAGDAPVALSKFTTSGVGEANYFFALPTVAEWIVKPGSSYSVAVYPATAGATLAVPLLDLSAAGAPTATEWAATLATSNAGETAGLAITTSAVTSSSTRWPIVRAFACSTSFGTTTNRCNYACVRNTNGPCAQLLPTTTISPTNPRTAGGTTDALGRLDVWNGGLRNAAGEVELRLRFNNAAETAATVGRFLIQQQDGSPSSRFSVEVDLQNRLEAVVSIGNIDDNGAMVLKLARWVSGAWSFVPGTSVVGPHCLPGSSSSRRMLQAPAIAPLPLSVLSSGATSLTTGSQGLLFSPLGSLRDAACAATLVVAYNPPAAFTAAPRIGVFLVRQMVDGVAIPGAPGGFERVVPVAAGQQLTLTTGAVATTSPLLFKLFYQVDDGDAAAKTWLDSSPVVVVGTQCAAAVPAAPIVTGYPRTATVATFPWGLLTAVYGGDRDAACNVVLRVAYNAGGAPATRSFLIKQITGDTRVAGTNPATVAPGELGGSVILRNGQEARVNLGRGAATTPTAPVSFKLYFSDATDAAAASSWIEPDTAPLVISPHCVDSGVDVEGAVRLDVQLTDGSDAGETATPRSWRRAQGTYSSAAVATAVSSALAAVTQVTASNVFVEVVAPGRGAAAGIVANEASPSGAGIDEATGTAFVIATPHYAGITASSVATAASGGSSSTAGAIYTVRVANANGASAAAASAGDRVAATLSAALAPIPTASGDGSSAFAASLSSNGVNVGSGGVSVAGEVLVLGDNTPAALVATLAQAGPATANLGTIAAAAAAGVAGLALMVAALAVWRRNRGSAATVPGGATVQRSQAGHNEASTGVPDVSPAQHRAAAAAGVITHVADRDVVEELVDSVQAHDEDGVVQTARSDDTEATAGQRRPKSARITAPAALTISPASATAAPSTVHPPLSPTAAAVIAGTARFASPPKVVAMPASPASAAATAMPSAITDDADDVADRDADDVAGEGEGDLVAQLTRAAARTLPVSSHKAGGEIRSAHRAMTAAVATHGAGTGLARGGAKAPALVRPKL